MKTLEYRLEYLPHLKKWVTRVTWGMLDTMLLYGGKTYDKQADARQAAVQHAEDQGVKPMILR